MTRDLKSINGVRSPGFDAYNSHFFKSDWPIIGEEITNAAMYFFSTRYVYKPINCITITFIPKA